MKNPLLKRLPREIRGDWKKYGALFLLLTAVIGFVSGMYIANGSMEQAGEESFEKYNIEDGHFEMKEVLSAQLQERMESLGMHIIPQFYKDQEEDKDREGQAEARIRVFQMRTEMNLASLHSGDFPKTEEEIVIDRMHADNAGIRVGDKIRLGSLDFTVSGLVSFSDYSTLFEKASDTMFDALTFNIAAVTPEGYERIQAPQVWQYAYQLEPRPVSTEEKKERSKKLVEQLAVLAATGGLTSDKEEAEKLTEETRSGTAYLEEMQARAELLEEKAGPLEKEGELLNKEKEALEAKSEALSQKSKELEGRGAALEEAGRELAERSAAFTARIAALSAEQQMAQAQSLEEERAALEKEAAALKEEEEALKAEGAKLKEEADQLTEEGNSLQLQAGLLQEKLDALQPEIDALEAEKERIEEITDRLKTLEPYEVHQNEITEFVPEYANQAIHFALTDFGTDKAMGEVLMVLFVLVLAFIFGLTTNSTITEEAAVIGTLRSLGYTRGEMLLHYAAPPVLVTLISALIGNILGYTVLKNVVASMYYNSYSLPVYETRWSGEALLKTTIIPLIVMLMVVTLLIARKLRISPLRFLRRDLSTSRRSKAVRLPRWDFLSRFRLRILFQNLGSYLTLILGIFFVMALLAFATGLPSTMTHEQEEARNHLLAPFQTVLKSMEDEQGKPLLTKEPSAEPFSMASLKTIEGVRVDEDISVYGYQPGSRYFDLPDETGTGKAYASRAFAEKFGLKAGQSLTLKDKYGPETYQFEIAGIYDLPGTVSLQLPQAEFNRLFGREAEDFDGFLSEKKLTDIPEDKVATVITLEDVLKMSRQMEHSLGGFMDYFAVICMGVAFLLIFLLTKLIIEKNAVSISMVKVLGYENREINSLYIWLTTGIVIVAAIVTAFISKPFMTFLWGLIMRRMNGWFSFYMSGWDMVKIIGMMIGAYLLVAFFDMRRIKRIPLTEALKNVE